MSVRQSSIGMVSARQTGSVAGKSEGAVDLDSLIGLEGQGLGSLSGITMRLVRSSLLAGIGIVNVHRLAATSLDELTARLATQGVSVDIASVGYAKAGRLKEFLGDLSQQGLYLLEFPGGYLLSYNDEILSFTPQ